MHCKGTETAAIRRLTDADVAMYPFVATLERSTTKAETLAREIGLHPLREIYPSVGRWMRLFESVPGYERTYPPHWRAAP
jgi:glutathione S-transferase